MWWRDRDWGRDIEHTSVCRRFRSACAVGNTDSDAGYRSMARNWPGGDIEHAAHRGYWAFTTVWIEWRALWFLWLGGFFEASHHLQAFLFRCGLQAHDWAHFE